MSASLSFRRLPTTPARLSSSLSPFLISLRHASSNNNPSHPSTEDLLKQVYGTSHPSTAAQAQQASAGTRAGAQTGGFGPFPQPEQPNTTQQQQQQQQRGPSAQRARPFPSSHNGPQFKEPTSFRVQRLGKNLVSFSVVGAGLLLTLTIVYSFSTEVLASGSATNVFNHCTPLLDASDDLHSILRSPLSYHGTPPHLRARRNRHISSSMKSHDEMLVKFWVDGAQRKDPSETVWDKVKRTVTRPLIVEPINHPVVAQQQPEHHHQPGVAQLLKQHQANSQRQSWGDWFKSGFAAILPSSFAGGGGGSGSMVRSSSSSSYPAKPPLGMYDTGEVSAALIRVADGSFQLKQLVVDFKEPGKPSWRITVVNKSDAQVKQDFHTNQANGTWAGTINKWTGLNLSAN